MENSIYLALSKQLVQRTNMNVIANNIANMNTSGYRGQNLVFEEYLFDQKGRNVDPRAAGDELSFVYNRSQYENTAPGSLTYTGNSLNAAIEGPGFFGMQGPNDEIMYSRAGEFQLDANGTLLSSAGFPVADQGGASIVIPPNSSEIKIDQKGFVSNQDGQIGQIMVKEFDDVQSLEAYGNNLYRSPEEGKPPENSRVMQGQVEGSNVQPIVEMTRMIETLRGYQSTQNVLKTENERLRGAIQKLTGQ